MRPLHHKHPKTLCHSSRRHGKLPQVLSRIHIPSSSILRALPQHQQGSWNIISSSSTAHPTSPRGEPPGDTGRALSSHAPRGTNQHWSRRLSSAIEGIRFGLQCRLALHVSRWTLRGFPRRCCTQRTHRASSRRLIHPLSPARPPRPPLAFSCINLSWCRSAPTRSPHKPSVCDEPGTGRPRWA